eukprot:TRINITY_DN13199_c0_g1_i15.p1 TRINITY_DN13199_c0_g1~~TRINITY_DN13199_c0_g1_i15.p1  ORF type:complete len:264 (+),score=98.23 TRINITY_DN13199_c0_g1_i15:101-892(+)
MFFFFFQAEDGIRDAQESRGLGDVYKRQGINAEYGRSGWQTMADIELENKADPGVEDLERRVEDVVSREGLTESQVAELRAAFEEVAVEVEGRGMVIEPYSLTQWLNKSAKNADLMSNFIRDHDLLGKMSKADIAGIKHTYSVEYSKELLGINDCDGDGFVSFEEWLEALFSTDPDAQEEEEDIQAFFNMFDADGDGYISFEELVAGMSDVGATEDQLRPVFGAFDRDGNSRLDFDEFRSLAQNILMELTPDEVQAAEAMHQK